MYTNFELCWAIFYAANVNFILSLTWQRVLIVDFFQLCAAISVHKCESSVYVFGKWQDPETCTKSAKNKAATTAPNKHPTVRCKPHFASPVSNGNHKVLKCSCCLTRFVIELSSRGHSELSQPWTFQIFCELSSIFNNFTHACFDLAGSLLFNCDLV